MPFLLSLWLNNMCLMQVTKNRKRNASEIRIKTNEKTIDCEGIDCITLGWNWKKARCFLRNSSHTAKFKNEPT